MSHHLPRKRLEHQTNNAGFLVIELLLALYLKSWEEHTSVMRRADRLVYASSPFQINTNSTTKHQDFRKQLLTLTHVVYP